MILTYNIRQDPATATVIIPVRNEKLAHKVDDASRWVMSDCRIVLPDSVSAWRLSIGAGLDAATLRGRSILLAASNTSIITPLAVTGPGTVEYTRVIENYGLPISLGGCGWSETHELRLDVDAAPAEWAESKIQISIRQLPAHE